MEWLRQLALALRNVARIARANPVWALTTLVLSPVPLLRHLFGVAVLFLISGLVLTLGMGFALGQIGVAKGTLLYDAIYFVIGIAIILIVLCALLQPLILHYGYEEGL